MTCVVKFFQNKLASITGNYRKVEEKNSNPDRSTMKSVVC